MAQKKGLSQTAIVRIWRAFGLQPHRAENFNFSKEPQFVYSRDCGVSPDQLRLRPLLMTSFAFILGCVPLWTASGAGSVARQVIGTTVIGGMMAETFVGRFFVPSIFYVVERVSGARLPGRGPEPSPAPGD